MLFWSNLNCQNCFHVAQPRNETWPILEDHVLMWRRLQRSTLNRGSKTCGLRSIARVYILGGVCVIIIIYRSKFNIMNECILLHIVSIIFWFCWTGTPKLPRRKTCVFKFNTQNTQAQIYLNMQHTWCMFKEVYVILVMMFVNCGRRWPWCRRSPSQ